MGKLTLTDFTLYRHRYKLGHALIAILLAVTLYTTGLFAPGGLSETEMRSAVRTGNITTDVLVGKQPEQILHLPYRLLQKASVQTFGMTRYTVKLPSLVLAAASALLFYGLLNLWFRRNVATIATLILITMGQFLLQSQQATPLISYMFWSVALLFSASMMARTGKHAGGIWLVLTAISSAFSLYSPYMLYVTLALLITALVHPHARFIIFKQPVWSKILAVLAFISLLVPLGFAIFKEPAVIPALVGVAGSPLIDSLNVSQQQLIDYVDFASPQNGRYLSPAYGLGAILVAAVGLWHLFRAKYTAKSYIMTVWLLFTLGVLIFNPNSIGFTLLPIAILIAFGFDYLIRSWYRLFPRNPYARIAGLLPLAILVAGLIFSASERFVYGYHYNPASSSTYRNDINLLDKELKNHAGKTVVLVPSEKQIAFYEYYARYAKNVKIIVSRDVASTVPKDSIVMYGPDTTKPALTAPIKIITSGVSKDANRFYIYRLADS